MLYIGTDWEKTFNRINYNLIIIKLKKYILLILCDHDLIIFHQKSSIC